MNSAFPSWLGRQKNSVSPEPQTVFIVTDTGVEEIPTLDTQLAACAWADKEATRLAAERQAREAPPVPVVQREPVAPIGGFGGPIFTASTLAMLEAQRIAVDAMTRVERNKKALYEAKKQAAERQAELERRKAAEIEAARLYGSVMRLDVTYGMTSDLGPPMNSEAMTSEPGTWWDRQPPPPKDYSNNAHHVGFGQPVSRSYIANGVRCYETKVPQVVKRVPVMDVRHHVVYDAARDLHICERCWRTHHNVSDFMLVRCKE